ncbi:MAG: polysaccharide deacetylase family protein [Pseudomonadota bacterium]
MDHDRYDWSMLHERRPIVWPDGAPVALWINVAVELFPLDDDGTPFKLPGSMRKPYPDVQTFTWRDYGNRVGIYRLMRAFDRFNVKPTWSVNGAIASVYPTLLRDIAARGDEIVAHGWDMASPHYGGLPETVEKTLISQTLDALGAISGTPIHGWLSPGKSQSASTPELLAQAGLEYVCDWPNDDMPYEFRTDHGPLVAMPHSDDMDDHRIIGDYKHDEDSFVEQVSDQFHWHAKEAQSLGGRVLSLNLHPWMIGQSHRISHLVRLLSFLSERCISLSAHEICEHWRAQQGN